VRPGQKVVRECIRRAFDRRFQNTLGFKHFSFIFQHGEILSCGMNIDEPNPYYERTLHAEYCAYSKARRRLSRDEFCCINVRIGRDHRIRLARPCQQCQRLLGHLGCTRFIYTIDDQSVGELTC